MKCLEKDRTRRYETANGLAADLKRHVNHEPVTARPPSAAYKFQKAFHRNKLVFTAALVVFAALAAGIAVSAWQAVRAKQARALALQSRNEAEKLTIFMLEDLSAELEPSGQFDTISRLAQQTVAYYDSLPPSLRTTDTDRNSAKARARLALVLSRQGDIKTALPLADEAVSRLEQIRKQDQSDGVIFALGLALEAQYFCTFFQFNARSEGASFEQAVATLRPFAIAADGSRRVKLQYANLLNYLSHIQPPERGVVTCREALGILAGIGALDLSDLNAATAWADVADSKARHALAIGQLDDAEQLEKQVQTLMEGVLKRRPSDLRARRNLMFAPDMLAMIAARRFHDDEALRWATQSRRAAEDYLRFNPSDSIGTDLLLIGDHSIASLLFRNGRVAEALAKCWDSVRTVGDHGNTGNFTPRPDFFIWAAIARWEAQRGKRDAADKALQQARRSLEAFASRIQLPDLKKEGQMELIHDAERQVRLAFGEDATVLVMATEAMPRLVKAKQSETHPGEMSVLSLFQRHALSQAARATLRLGRLVEAETAARALVSLPLVTEEFPSRLSMDQPDELFWGRVLLAQAVVEQGRKAEALQTLEPALVYYRETQAQGASHLAFRQRFARALFVQALAQPADGNGTAQRRDWLSQAAKLLHDLSEEARQLHDSSELLSWIAAAQKKLDQEAPQP
jgi:tetratricopeptide (TPR) repeat protein